MFFPSTLTSTTPDAMIKKQDPLSPCLNMGVLIGISVHHIYSLTLLS